MVAYEFYRHDKVKENELVGILPERRINPERIDQESIINWVKMVFGDTEDIDNIFFIQVNVYLTVA
jgi:hypothetical protein